MFILLANYVVIGLGLLGKEELQPFVEDEWVFKPLKNLPFQNPHYRTPGFAMRD
jgi:hypothetical protein